MAAHKHNSLLQQSTTEKALVDLPLDGLVTGGNLKIYPFKRNLADLVSKYPNANIMLQNLVGSFNPFENIS